MLSLNHVSDFSLGYYTLPCDVELQSYAYDDPGYTRSKFIINGTEELSSQLGGRGISVATFNLNLCQIEVR